MPGSSNAVETEALRRRVSSLEESNGLLQHRVGQLEAAVAVLARLVEHPLVQEALDGGGEEPTSGQAHGSGHQQAGTNGDANGEGDTNGDAEPDNEEMLRSLKRSRSGKPDPNPSKKKWYELIALIKSKGPCHRLCAVVFHGHKSGNEAEQWVSDQIHHPGCHRFGSL
eukprot:scaffold523944_cov35-Prasinocladus_malaysianus.AAC.1